jgi:restriction endonuclease S subunit
LLDNNDTEDVMLGELCDFKSGKFNSKDCKKEGLYSFYNGKENQPAGKSDKYCIDEKEYIIFLKDGGSGKGKYGKHIGLGNVYYENGKTGFTSHQLAFIPKSNTKNLKYIYHFLNIKNN